VGSGSSDRAGNLTGHRRRRCLQSFQRAASAALVARRSALPLAGGRLVSNRPGDGNPQRMNNVSDPQESAGLHDVILGCVRTLWAGAAAFVLVGAGACGGHNCVLPSFAGSGVTANASTWVSAHPAAAFVRLCVDDLCSKTSAPMEQVGAGEADGTSKQLMISLTVQDRNRRTLVTPTFVGRLPTVHNPTCGGGTRTTTGTLALVLDRRGKLRVAASTSR
jgi:hypothetical protein